MHLFQDEYQNATLHQYVATEEELRKQFTDRTSAVSRAGLRLLSAREVVIRCPFNVEFKRMKREKSGLFFRCGIIDNFKMLKCQSIVENLFRLQARIHDS